MKVVLTYGTYDLFHHGHVRLLSRARALGDRLIVGLSTDRFNSVKGKRSFYTYDERKAVLEALRVVDLVIPEERWDQKVEDIKAQGVDVLVMGDDWAGKFDSLGSYCEVVYLPYTTGVSSTAAKRFLLEWANEHGAGHPGK